MSNFRLKTKLLAGALGIIIFLMVLSILGTSIIISRQNQETSYNYLRQSLSVIRDEISSMTKKLLINSRQISQSGNMGDNISFLEELRGTEGMESTVASTFKTVAKIMFNISQISDIWKTAMYDSKGDLLCFIIFDNNQSFMGFPMPDGWQVANLKTGEMLVTESWKKADSDVDINKTYGKTILTSENVEFEKIDNQLCLVSFVPISAKKYNVDKDKYESVQVGFITATLQLKTDFVDKMAKLTNTKINVFTKTGLSVGLLKDYKKLDFHMFSSAKGDWQIENQDPMLNEIQLNEDDYFQGILPVYNESVCVGAVTALYTKAISKANTIQVVKLLCLIFLISFVIVVVITVFASNALIKPILQVVDGLKDIAEGEGDLTIRLKISGNDEIGELARWFNIFIERLQAMIRQIVKRAEAIDTSSSTLNNLSSLISNETQNMSAKSENVASAAQEMSANIGSVAESLKDSSFKASIVASSVEEVTVTVNEIAKNSNNARIVTADAVTMASSASEKLNQLDSVVQEVSKFTEIISEISEQTNLLALNATIEAARAGEAGKGFTVVASEIKELAKQTADATVQIKQQIDAIQGSSSETIGEIDQILTIINNVNEITTSIASAVEEQSVTTQDIAGNIAQTSQGISEVNDKMTKNSQVAQEITKDISEVNHSTTEMTNSNSEVSTNASELSELSSQLKELVGKFKV